MQQNKIRLMTLYFGVVALLAGCASQPTLNTSSDANKSFDGLYPIEGGQVDRAWARADLDLSGYSKMMLQSAGIHYRPVKANKNGSTRKRVGKFC